MKTLQAVEVQLERHILGLEEETVIPKDPPKPRERGLTVEEEQRRLGAMGKPEEKDIVSINEGAMGKLDLGWLNSRAGRVDRGMEAELWSKARRFLEDEAGKGITKESKDHDMED